jgi:hypothetical protein
MSNTDVAKTVNTFMLSSAPTLTEATPMAYDLLKALARQLLFNIRTTKEHAQYVMGKKYGHIYTQPVIMMIVDEAFGDELSERIQKSQKVRASKRAMAIGPRQPVLLSA